MIALKPAAGPMLCTGAVIHRRITPVGHAFRYRACFLRIPLSWLDAPSPVRRPWLLGIDRFNLFSVMRRDYGARDGSALEGWVRRLLADNAVHGADGEIVLYTLPRVLGYVFNPVSFWMCHDRSGRLRAVLCEVSNTFGEHHNYLVARDDGEAIGTGQGLTARKVFHVSPFFPVEGEYRFRFHENDARCVFRIDYSRAGSLQLTTALSGDTHGLTSPGLARAFLRLPWLMVGVIGRIHLQAIRLWWKGAVFHPKPQPPAQSTTR
ncbi:MAG: DUF1365 domain-containing protein [Proteobacteria bacterium]|nr:DUF1365 domain-containing protein [Burkholderiales bacterium]